MNSSRRKDQVIYDDFIRKNVLLNNSDRSNQSMFLEDGRVSKTGEIWRCIICQICVKFDSLTIGAHCLLEKGTAEFQLNLLVRLLINEFFRFLFKWRGLKEIYG